MSLAEVWWYCVSSAYRAVLGQKNALVSVSLGGYIKRRAAAGEERGCKASGVVPAAQYSTAQHSTRVFQKRCQAVNGAAMACWWAEIMVTTISQRPPRLYSRHGSQMVTHFKCRAPCVLDISAPGLEMRHGYRVGKQANRTTLSRSCRLCPQIQNKQWRGNVIAKDMNPRQLFIPDHSDGTWSEQDTEHFKLHTLTSFIRVGVQDSVVGCQGFTDCLDTLSKSA